MNLSDFPGFLRISSDFAGFPRILPDFARFLLTEDYGNALIYTGLLLQALSYALGITIVSDLPEIPVLNVQYKLYANSFQMAK